MSLEQSPPHFWILYYHRSLQKFPFFEDLLPPEAALAFCLSHFDSHSHGVSRNYIICKVQTGFDGEEVEASQLLSENVKI